MTPKAKLVFAALWSGGWGALMSLNGPFVLLSRHFHRSMPPALEGDWIERLALSYLFLGPFLILAAFRLHAGRRWPRVPLQIFQALFALGIAVFFIFWIIQIQNRIEGGPLIVMHIARLAIWVGGAVICFGFAAGAVQALRCLRSEDVRNYASRSGF